MLFSSNVFLYVFLPMCFLLYYLGRSRSYRNIVLLVFSIIFYAWGEPVYIVLMLVSVMLNYAFALAISRYEERNNLKKLILVLSVVVNILIIGYYKYSGFIITNINKAFGLELPVKEIALPIGISFFTFQAMSYVIDVYRHDGKVQRNILNVALYISLFPQLVAGPIVRYQTVADQIEDRKENMEDISAGCYRFIMGLGKKVLLSNVFAVIADYAFDNTVEISVAMAWLGAISYTLQIYFDFSGYSDMAIGMGRMFGFTFLENFNYPYISKSVSDFWRRWHISLSTWFRDYVYIPLGGNRVSKVRNLFNLAVVWTLTGVWHGANWTFICWGVYYLIFLVLEKFIIGGALDKIKGFRHIYTIVVVIFGWVLFRADSISHAFEYIKVMLFGTGAAVTDNTFLHYLEQYKFFWIVGIIGSTPFVKQIGQWIEAKSALSTAKQMCFVVAKCVFAAFIMLMTWASLVANSYNPFIYFNF